MRVLIVVPIALLFAVTSTSCFFGGGDDDPTPTATSSLPTLTPTPTIAPTETPTVVPTVAPSPTATQGPASYVVQEGDSLSIIADRFGTTVEELLALNEIEDQNLIFVGQVIDLPEGTSGGE